MADKEASDRGRYFPPFQQEKNTFNIACEKNIFNIAYEKYFQVASEKRYFPPFRQEKKHF